METAALHHVPSSISREIDQGRLHNQWNAVVKMLEDLARTCDIGAARLDVDAKRRTYFWTVWAEALLELDHDYQKAMLCIGKAIELDHDATEWRIIFVRLLLEWTSNIVIPGVATAPLHASYEGGRKMGITKELEVNAPVCKQAKIYIAREVLADVLKEFPPGEQQMILEQFPDDHIQNESTQAVLFALSILPLQSRQQCCHDILSFIHEKDWRSLHLKNSLTFVVYLICIDMLKVISCDEIYETIYIETINEYTMYLQIDAIIGKSIMYEALGEYIQARDTLNLLIYNVLPESDADIDTLKLSFQTSTLYAICRLPLIEKLCGMTTESLTSFKRCVSSNSLLKDRIPTATKSALTFSAATLLLNRARMSSSVENEHSDLKSALSLLQASQQMLEGHGSSPKPFEYFNKSLVRKLPFTLSSPESITNFATPGRIAILLSSISKRGGKVLPNSIELLEWSVNFEVQLDVELLWAMADAYAQEDDQERAISLFQQTHDNLMNSKEAIHAYDIVYSKQESEFSSIVSWLSTGPHPVACPWLPTIRATNVCLDRLCDPRRAITILMKNVKDLHPKKIDILSDILSLVKTPVKHVDPVVTLTMKLNKEGESMTDDAIFACDADNNNNNNNNVSDIDREKHSSLEDINTLDEITDPLFNDIRKTSDEYFHKLGEFGDSGFLEILFELGRACAIASRSPNDKKIVNRGHRKGALIVFSIIIKHYEVVLSSTNFPEKLLVEFACVLAEEGLLSDAKRVVRMGIDIHKNSSRLSHLLALLYSSVAGYDDDLSSAIKICDDTFISKSSINVGLTLALLKWATGQKDSCLSIMDNLVNALKDNMLHTQEATRSSLSEKGLQNNVIFDDYILNWDRSPQALRLSTEIFVTASSVFRQCGMLDKARDCTDMAWKVLYTVNANTICDLDFTNDEDRAELLRRLPQSSGWRLRDACGWGAVKIPDCEAEIIAECAAQYLAGEDTASAVETYKIALMEFPYHVPSLIALAELELSKIPGNDLNLLRGNSEDVPDFKALFVDGLIFEDEDDTNDTNIDSTNDDIDSGDNRSFEDITEGATKALHYASLAVRFDDEISETWYVAGKVYEALTCNDEAKVALWKALELGDQMVVRKFHWALVDT